MDNEFLVGSKIAEGKELIRALDKNHKIRVAGWCYFSDSEQWKLVIAFDDIKREDFTNKAFGILAEEIVREKYQAIEISDIKPIHGRDPLVEGLSGIIHTDKDSLNELWFSGNYLNGIYLPTLMLYRSA